MSEEGGAKNKLEIIAARTFRANDELYRVVDFLNKNLKHKRLMFGLTREKEKEEMVITIYEI